MIKVSYIKDNHEIMEGFTCEKNLENYKKLLIKNGFTIKSEKNATADEIKALTILTSKPENQGKKLYRDYIIVV